MMNLKENSGITLVALVVTIIVLLILAGITINLVAGKEGLVTTAQGIKANIETAEAEGQAKINSLQQAEYTEDGAVIMNDEDAPTINSLEVTDITNSSFTVKVNVTETGSGLAKIEYSIDDGEHYVTPDNSRAKAYTFGDVTPILKEYKVKVKATDVNNNSSYASKTIEKCKIGDYVNYTYDPVASGYNLTKELSGYTNSSAEDGSQTIEQSSETLQWRILNINEKAGTIDLVSATPTSNDVYFKGTLGYNNGVYLLNDICATLYSNSSKGITARSINLEDTEKHLTTAGLNKRNDFKRVDGSSSVQYGTTKTYTSYYWYPNLYAYEIGSGVNVAETNASSISQPNTTIANPDPYKEGKASPSTRFTVPTTVTTETDSKTQASNSVLTVTQTGYYGISFNDSNKYYDEAGAVLTSSNLAYWVASRYASCNSSYAYFGLRYVNESMIYSYLFRSDGKTTYSRYRLRPVVSLSSSLLSDTKDSNGHWNLK